MNKFITRSIIGLLVTLATTSLHAFGVTTHAQITNKAYDASVLSTDPTVLEDLNIDILNTQNPFSDSYYHILSNNLGVAERQKSVFAKDNMQIDSQTENSTVRGWLMRGAIREDDYPPDEGFIQGVLCKNDPKNPQDDPQTDTIA